MRRHLEALCRAHDVMEVQIDRAAVVATYDASAARLGNQRASNSLLSARYVFANTASTAPANVARCLLEAVVNHRAVMGALANVLRGGLDGAGPTGLKDQWLRGFIATRRHEHMFAQG